MKEAVVLVVLAVLVVGGVGIWIANSGSSLSIFGSTQPAAQPVIDQAQAEQAAEEAKKADEAKKKPAAKAVRKAPVVPQVEPVAPPVAPVAEVVVAPAPPPPAPKQFPEPRQISVGAERDNIAERFGQPALATTTTSDDGRVMETMVYARKSGRDVTVIRIEDGKVLSAHSR
jgi:cytoskeletal protein RodZ